MTFSLRDQLAARFAAALAGRGQSPELLVRHAYDLAEAMLAERARRADADAASACEVEEALVAESDLAFAGYEDDDVYATAAQETHALHGELARPLLDVPVAPPDADSSYEAYLEEVDPRWLDPVFDPSWELEPKWQLDGAREAGEGQASAVPESARPGLARAEPRANGSGRGRERTG